MHADGAMCIVPHWRISAIRSIRILEHILVNDAPAFE